MNYELVRVLRMGLWLVIVFLAWGLVAAEAWGQIPIDAAKYKRDLIRNARLEWGLDAPIATFAAQIHQESGWRPDAKSPVGALGIAQFMPGTSAWLSKLYAGLEDNEPANPAWALRALVAYDKYLYDRVPHAITHCEQMAMVLSSYNGGLGWLLRDVQVCGEHADCDTHQWFDNVERYNGGRSAAAFKENRGYPKRILQDLERRYRDAGWGIYSC